MSSSTENKNDIQEHSNVVEIVMADMPDNDSDDELPDLIPCEIPIAEPSPVESVESVVENEKDSREVDTDGDILERKVIEEKDNDSPLPPLEDIDEDEDSEPEHDENDENNENDPDGQNGMVDVNPGECPFGAYCPVKVAMDNNIGPSVVRGDPIIRDHIDTYHRHLNFLFSRQYSRMRGELDMIRFVLNSSGIINGGMINGGPILRYGDVNRHAHGHMDDNTEQKESKCNLCENYYDHDDYAPFFMSCCANSYCIKCVKELKTDKKKCPSCESYLEYLNDIKISKKEKKVSKNSEDCLICCDTMNSTQYNGKVILDCNCKLEICISCAYKSLTDTKHVKMGSVQGIEGLVLPQHYTVKGACPACRQIPANKDEIISLYGFLPPRR